jgi:hypothetical protein
MVAYDPSCYGTLGLHDWAVEKGTIAQLVMLIHHLRGHTDQGRLILIALSWWHLYSGTTSRLLQDPHLLLPFADHHIFSVLRSFLQELNGSFYVTALDEMLPSPNRNRDVGIMQAIAALPVVSSVDLNRCIRCRLFLCITYLSEVSTANGLSIARDAWTGTTECLRQLSSSTTCISLLPYSYLPLTAVSHHANSESLIKRLKASCSSEYPLHYATIRP